MKDSIKNVVALLALGASLVAYAHTNFSSKSVTLLILDDLRHIKTRIDFLYTNAKDK